MTRLSSRRAFLPIERSTALPRPPPARRTVAPRGSSVAAPVGPMASTGSPGFKTLQSCEEAPSSSAIMERSPLPASTQAPVPGVAGEEGHLVGRRRRLEPPAPTAVRSGPMRQKEAAALVHRESPGPLLFVGDVGRRAGGDPAGAGRHLHDVAAERAPEPDG